MKPRRWMKLHPHRPGQVPAPAAPPSRPLPPRSLSATGTSCRTSAEGDERRQLLVFRPSPAAASRQSGVRCETEAAAAAAAGDDESRHRWIFFLTYLQPSSFPRALRSPPSGLLLPFSAAALTTSSKTQEQLHEFPPACCPAFLLLLFLIFSSFTVLPLHVAAVFTEH